MDPMGIYQMFGHTFQGDIFLDIHERRKVQDVGFFNPPRTQVENNGLRNEEVNHHWGWSYHLQ